MSKQKLTNKKVGKIAGQKRTKRNDDNYLFTFIPYENKNNIKNKDSDVVNDNMSDDISYDGSDLFDDIDDPCQANKSPKTVPNPNKKQKISHSSYNSWKDKPEKKKIAQKKPLKTKFCVFY